MNDKATAVRFMLDYLRHGPQPLEILCRDAWGNMRITRAQITDAGKHLGIGGEKLNGTWFAMLPRNLSAIWWARRAQPQPYSLQNSGGNTA
jgi:hypothetical protein